MVGKARLPLLFAFCALVVEAFVPALSKSNTPSTGAPKVTLGETSNQQWDVDLYQKHKFVFEYGSSLIDLLDPKPGERILDVGCGSGQLTKEISDRGADAIGFDADPSMVEKSKVDYPELDFFEADVTKLSTDLTDGTVDAVFSNAALHWVKDADAAVAAMAKVLRPGGRFVVELGGKGNVESILDAARQTLDLPSTTTPWYFPSISEYTSLLEAHGIEVLSAVLFDRPTKLEDGDKGMANWLRMFGGTFLRDLPEPSKSDVIDKITARLRTNSSLWDGIDWYADYRRLRIVGRKMEQKSYQQ